MFCPRCGVSCETGQTICHVCSAPLPLAVAATEATAELAAPYTWDAVWVTTEPASEPVIDRVDRVDRTPPGTVRPAVDDVEQSVALNVIAVLAVLAGFLTIVGAFLAQLTITSDAPIADALGDYKLNDLAAAFRSGGLFTGSNLQVGVIVVGVLMVIGAVLAVLRRSYGAALASGASLALLPVTLCIWGNVRKIADTAVLQAQDAKIATRLGTYVQTQAAVGVYFIAAASVLGIAVIIVSLVAPKSDPWPPFNRILGIVGALASLVAAAGQLVPENGVSFSNNFSTDTVGLLLLSGHLAVIGVVALCGVVGFLWCNRWGIALAFGGISVYLWQWVSSVGNLGAFPAEPAFGRPGSIDLKPHATTTIGLITMLIIGASTLVLTGQNREGPP
jgi:hypothetical protein